MGKYVFKRDMINKCAAVFLLSLCAFFSSSFAANITGAFGVKLGEKLNKLHVINVSSTTDDEPLYEITPVKRVKFWDDYYVLITPITKKVYSIWGIKRGLSKIDCEANLEAVASIIEKKYRVRKQEPIFSLDKDYFFEKGNGVIDLKCDSNFDSDFNEVYDFYIQYYSKELENKASQERVKLKAKGVKNTDAL